MPPKIRRFRERMPLAGPGRHIIDTSMILVGSFITALAFNLFLVPNHIASGGVSGLSVIAQSLFGIEPAFTQWALNIPLFIAGFWHWVEIMQFVLYWGPLYYPCLYT